MVLQKRFEDWIIKEKIHPRIDLREHEGSYLCDEDYEGSGHLMVSADSIVEFINKKWGVLSKIEWLKNHVMLEGSGREYMLECQEVIDLINKAFEDYIK